MDSPIGTELREILSHYDLGELIDYEKNERGFVNTAFAIDTDDRGQRRRLFMRKYKRGIREEELQFEHSLVAHLVACGLPVARIYPTRAGKTYLQRFEAADDANVIDGGVFYTIFDYLPGEDRYTWVDPVLSDAGLYASGAVLAQFHIAARSFTPRGRRAEPKILELLPVIAKTWAGSPAKSKGSIFDEHIMERLDLVSDNLATTMAALGEPVVRSLPEMAIHCDYHPGNLKFTGEAVTGLFDFDWSKIDLRVFDLGLALWYFCTSWQGSQDGSFRLDWARTFLRAYLKMIAANTEATPLSPEEIRYLPVMINAANLYVLNWTILDYYNKDVDPQEYLVFLDHSLNFTVWYEDPKNRRELEGMVWKVRREGYGEGSSAPESRSI